jgi:hypothetical protein
MPASNFVPGRSLVVVLGASRFPSSPGFAAGAAFFNSADRLLRYFTDENGMKVGKGDVLDLFDDTTSAIDQLGNIQRFISSRTNDVSRASAPANLFVYYVGHGLFTTDRRYCLAVRQTIDSSVGISAIRGHDLAEIVSQSASFLRRFLILDCCFAGSLFSEFQAGPAEAATSQMLERLPKRGTALLCASSRTDVALAPTTLDHTMFSDALLKALRQGNPVSGSCLSLRELGAMLVNILEHDHPDRWVRPEVHSPDMPEGDLSDIPIFPNPGWLPPPERNSFERERQEEAEQKRQEQEAATQAEHQRREEEAAAQAEQRRQEEKAAAQADQKRKRREREAAAKAEERRRENVAAVEAEQRRREQETAAKVEQRRLELEAAAKAQQQSKSQAAAKPEQQAQTGRGWFSSLLLLYTPARPASWFARAPFYLSFVLFSFLAIAAATAGISTFLEFTVGACLMLSVLRAFALWVDNRTRK